MDLLSAGRLVAFDDHGVVRVTARKYAKRYAAKYGVEPLPVEIVASSSNLRRLMLTIILSIINFFSGSAFQGIVGAVTGVIGKLSSDQATEFTAAAGAEQAVLVARMQADSQAYQARVSLYRGMFWLQFALLAAYVGPLWHSLLVYLDTCPFLPLFTLEHWFELAPHVVGSWRVGALPGNYGTEEWQTIASLLGIQTAAVGGFMYFLHK